MEETFGKSTICPEQQSYCFGEDDPSMEGIAGSQTNEVCGNLQDERSKLDCDGDQHYDDHHRRTCSHEVVHSQESKLINEVFGFLPVVESESNDSMLCGNQGIVHSNEYTEAVPGDHQESCTYPVTEAEYKCSVCDAANDAPGCNMTNPGCTDGATAGLAALEGNTSADTCDSVGRHGTGVAATSDQVKGVHHRHDEQPVAEGSTLTDDIHVLGAAACEDGSNADKHEVLNLEELNHIPPINSSCSEELICDHSEESTLKVHRSLHSKESIFINETFDFLAKADQEEEIADGDDAEKDEKEHVCAASSNHECLQENTLDITKVFGFSPSTEDKDTLGMHPEGGDTQSERRKNSSSSGDSNDAKTDIQSVRTAQETTDELQRSHEYVLINEAFGFLHDQLDDGNPQAAPAEPAEQHGPKLNEHISATNQQASTRQLIQRQKVVRVKTLDCAIPAEAAQDACMGDISNGVGVPPESATEGLESVCLLADVSTSEGIGVLTYTQAEVTSNDLQQPSSSRATCSVRAGADVDTSGVQMRNSARVQQQRRSDNKTSSASSGDSHRSSSSHAASDSPCRSEDSEDDDDGGVYAETFRYSSYMFVGADKLSVVPFSDDLLDGSTSSCATADHSELRDSVFNSSKDSDFYDQSFDGEVTPKPERRGHSRSDSISTTASEKEFCHKYQAKRTRLIRRNCSIAAYKRLSDKFLEVDREILVERTEGDTGFGFHINGTNPVVVSTVVQGGAAERAGVKVGDVLMLVNDINVLDATHQHIQDIMIKDSQRVILGVAAAAGGQLTDIPLCSGYLSKRSGIIRSWRRRWFVLKADHCLYYYKHEGDTDPLGAIPVVNYTVSKASEVSRKHVFKMVRYNEKNYYLQAGTEDDMTRWANAITTAASSHSKNDTWLDVTSHNVGVSALAIKNADCHGYVYKMGGRNKSWKRRYCVLKDACLYYYIDVNSSTAKGVAHFHGYKVQCYNPNNKRFAFMLIPPEPCMRTFNFYTENETDMKRWTTALQDSITRWVRVDD